MIKKLLAEDLSPVKKTVRDLLLSRMSIASLVACSAQQVARASR